MATSEPTPVKKIRGGYCPSRECTATHWLIEVGFDGEEGELYLPSKASAEACMKHFVMPYECGDIGHP